MRFRRERWRANTLILLVCAVAFAAPAQQALDPARVDAVVRAQMAELHVPGVQVVVTRGERVIYEKAYGVANVSTREPMTLEHRIRVGSITKMMTGMAVLTLAVQNKVNLDAPVSRYIGVAPEVGRITVRQALSHSTRYGYGINHSRWRGVRVLTHAGRLEGYGSTLTMAPDQKVSVAVLTNWFNTYLWRTAAEIIAQLTPVEEQAPVAVPAALTDAERREYAGHFVNPPFDETLAVRGDKLIWRAARSPVSEEREGEVHKLSNGIFEAVDKAGVQIAVFTFVRDAGGRVKYLARPDLRALRAVR